MCCPPGLPGTIHLGCIVSMMPHFVFGAVVLRKFGYRLWEKRVMGLSCLFAFIAFIVVEGDVTANGMSFYTADSSIRAFGSFGSGACFFLRPIVGLLGAVGVMTLIRLVFDVVPFISCVAKIGTLTLGIYIFHLWPLQRLRCIAWIGSSRLSVVVTAIAMLLVFSLATWLLMEKTGRFRKWIWGK